MAHSAPRHQFAKQLSSCNVGRGGSALGSAEPFVASALGACFKFTPVHTVVLDTFSIAIICCYVAFCYNDGSLTSCAVSIFDFTPSFNNIIIGLFDTDLTSICCTSCQYNELIEFIVSL